MEIFENPVAIVDIWI